MSDYKFLGITTAVCEECIELIPTKVIEDNGVIYFYKECKKHGIQKTKVSTDVEYFMQCLNPQNQKFICPENVIESNDNCPKDCGLCTRHEQKTCMAMVELTDDCNIKCATCIAGSCPGGQMYISLEDMNKIINTLYLEKDTIDLLMLSGGEPTIHPQIFDIIDLCKKRGVRHLMLISNGVRIAKDENFVKELAKRKQNLEIYLQFDSLRPESLIDIRGLDLSDVRRNAVEMLEKYKINSTLVCIVKKGTNDSELKEIINFARSYSHVRGITLQPLKNIGRGDTFNKDYHYITLTEVRDLVGQTGFMDKKDMIPHPCNTACMCIGYVNDKNEPMTEYLYHNFENRDKLKELVYYLPDLDTGDVLYQSLFRITIVSFLDKYNFNLSDVRKSCIHFVSADGKIVPFDTHYVYHRDEE